MIRKNKRVIKIVTLVLTGVLFISGVVTNAFEDNGGYEANVEDYGVNIKNLAVIVKEKSLWAVDMINGRQIEIDKGGEFKNPKISQGGINVAYTKDNSLYVSRISAGDSKSVIKLKDQPLSYSWRDSDTLIYSLYEGGLYEYSLKDKRNVVYIDSQERYRNMVYGKDGKIYYEKYYDYTKDGQQYSIPKGLMSYDVLNKKETTIIKPRNFDEEKKDFGLIPVISKLSPDGRYIYIWMKSKSASLNADGVGVGVYDIDKEKLITVDNKKTLVLAYNDNIAISPIDSSLVALNNGGARDMNRNKTIVMTNIIIGTWEEVLPKDMISTSGVYGEEVKGITTMTQVFSPNGKAILYSGAKAMEKGSQWEKEAHNIYSVNIKNKKVEQITKGNHFDFAPNYIDNGEAIVFLRKVSDKEFQLWKVEDDKESCLLKGIKIDENSWYYGHYDIEGVMDVYIGK